MALSSNIFMKMSLPVLEGNNEVDIHTLAGKNPISCKSGIDNNLPNSLVNTTGVYLKKQAMFTERKVQQKNHKSHPCFL